MKIVVLDGYTLNPGDNPWTGLEQFGEVEIYDHTLENQVVARSAGAQALVVNKVKLSGETLAQLSELKFIGVTATGYDCVDVNAARQRDISVANVPVYGTDSVAQFVFALLLELCHHVALHDEAVKQGEWSGSSDFCFWKTPLIELSGKTMGIVGFGRIGRRVGEMAHVFGMQVVAYDTYHGSLPSYQPFSWVETVSDLVRQADFISLHCNLTQDNVGLVNRDFLQHAKPNACLINASRGGLVMEADLAEALNCGKIAGAAVDVVSTEPIAPENPLLKARNCVITPHIAWATIEARRRLMETTVKNVANFFAGKPTNVVNAL